MNSNKKELIIIAGANGSGKTTFAKQLLKSFDYSYLNADEIAKELSPEDLTKSRISAGKKFFAKFETMVSKNKNIIIESTLSGKFLTKLINNLRKKDYMISIFFILVNTPEECIHRVKQRVLKGEHYIPDEDIIRRFNRGKSNFWKIYRFSVDFWCLIDNSSYNFDEVAVGIKDEYRIINKKLYKMFIRKIK